MPNDRKIKITAVIFKIRRRDKSRRVLYISQTPMSCSERSSSSGIFDSRGDSRGAELEGSATTDGCSPLLSSSRSETTTPTPLEDSVKPPLFISDILPLDSRHYIDEPIAEEFAECLAANKFPLKTQLEIARTPKSPHAKNAEVTIISSAHYYLLLNDIFESALIADGYKFPPSRATEEESLTREFCGFTTEGNYE